MGSDPHIAKQQPIFSAGEWTGLVVVGWAICHSRRHALALLDVPKLSRESMGWIVSVASRRRGAIATFSGSPWRRAAQSSGGKRQGHLY